MNRFVLLTFTFCFITTLFAGSNFADLSNMPQYHPNHIIVKFQKDIPLQLKEKNNLKSFGIAELDRLNNKFSCKKIDKMFANKSVNLKLKKQIGLDRIYILHFKKNIEIKDLIEDYFKTGLFEYVEHEGACI